MSEPKYLYAEFEAFDGHADEVVDLLRGYAQQVGEEPGNLVFEAHTLTEQPNKFFVFEKYASQADFEAHVAAPYCDVFNQQLAPLVHGGGSRLTWLMPVE